jgi:hypothetical protein
MTTATISDPIKGTDRHLEKPVTAPPAAALSKIEIIIGVSAFILMLVLRWFYLRSHPWNSDEPQHLHVVWAWANGLLPYRDVFDNHSPLFSWLHAPLLRWLGERPDIVELMRVAMWPLFAIDLWCLYKIGAVLFSPRCGLWAAVFAGLLPNWFVKMGEFRTDVLWTTLWLITLLILVTGRLNSRRLFFAGLTLGAAFSVSMKTTFLLLTLIAAAGAALAIQRLFINVSLRVKIDPSAWLRHTAAAIAGLMIIPGLFIGFFAAHGALPQLYYCVIQHNLIPGSHTPWHLIRGFRSVHTLVFLPAIILAATTLPLFATDPIRAFRLLFLRLAAGFGDPLLHGLWTMITSQDYLPLYPLMAIVVAPSILWIGVKIAEYSRWRAPLFLVPALVACAELVWLVYDHPLWIRPNAGNIAAITEVLRITKPGEYVMDAKGDSIFRPRPYYFVLETLTRKRLYKGFLSDELPERLIATRTAVLRDTSRMTFEAKQFVAQNYIPVGYVSVAGQMLAPRDDHSYSFEVAIPMCYTLVSQSGTLSGLLDGAPWDGPRVLSPGPHEFQRATGSGYIALVWARATEKGFSPFSRPRHAAREATANRLSGNQ